jgi:hypothetical protein
MTIRTRRVFLKARPEGVPDLERDFGIDEIELPEVQAVCDRRQQQRTRRVERLTTENTGPGADQGAVAVGGPVHARAHAR